MEKRIQYIDAIKGFAILLVVMGHVLAWNFPHDVSIQFEDSQSVNVIMGGVVFQLIYSFHMPLFFLVSGYLSGGKELNCFVLIRKEITGKVKRLLIPYFFTGFIIYLVRGHYGYWFLLTLFELYVCWIFLCFVLSKLKKKGVVVDTVVLILGFLLLKIFHVFSIPPICGIELGKFVPFYIPFAFGVLMKRNRAIENMVASPLCFTICLIFFCLFFCSRYVSDYPILYQISNKFARITSLLACICVFHVFMIGFSKKLILLFSYIGTKTMPIYILHIIFVVQIVEVGEFIIHSSPVTSLVLQITYSLYTSSIAILLSLCTYKIIKYSPHLTRLLFGE